MTESRDSIVKRTSDDVTALADNADKLRQLAKFYFQGGSFPNISNEFAAMVCIEAGRELGIPPIMALQTIYPIKGRLTIEAKTMLALFQQNGGKIKTLTRTPEKCEIELSREDNEPQAFAFTMAEAIKAGLAKKDNWVNYPSDMLFARAVSRGIRSYDPRCILGMYSKEEAVDGDIALPDSPMPDVKIINLADRNNGTAPAAGPVVEGEVVKPAEDKPKATKKGANKPAPAAKAEPQATTLPAPSNKGLLDEETTENEAVQPQSEAVSDAKEPTIGEIVVAMCNQIVKDYGRTDIFGKAAVALNSKYNLGATADNLGTLDLNEEQASFIIDALEKTIAVAAGKAKMAAK